MDVKEMAEWIRKVAVDHGWEDTEREQGTWIALAHSELSEAFELIRTADAPGEMWNDDDTGKPEGYLVELADCVIRCLHHMQNIIDTQQIVINGVDLVDLKKKGHPGISPESVIYDKVQFNETREYRHGGKSA